MRQQQPSRGFPRGIQRGAAAHRVVRPRSSCNKCALCQAVLQRLAPSCTDSARSARRVGGGAGLLRTPSPRAGVWIASPGVSPTPHRRATAHAPRRGPSRLRALPPSCPTRATLLGTLALPAPSATAMARWQGMPSRCGPPVVEGPQPAATALWVPYAEEAPNEAAGRCLLSLAATLHVRAGRGPGPVPLGSAGLSQ